ncbi:MAG: DUF4339 domain-containing protein [Myxococcota bacterium]
MSLPRMPAADEDVLHLHASATGRVGPISRRALAARLADGTVPAAAHVWMDGMAGWEPLAHHRDALLAGLGASDAPSDTARSTHDAGPASADGVTPADAATAAGALSADDEADRVFVGLVRDSWAYLEQQRFAGQIDEVFLGAVITSTLDTGYSLIDLASDGTHHYLRFENLADRTRIIVRSTHLTGSLAVAKVLGQRVSAVIGYGEKVGNIGKIWSAIQAEMKSSYLSEPEPGTITVDGDVNSGYVYCQVDLLLDLSAYVADDYRIDLAKLTAHIGATTSALRKYLRGRFA